MSPRSEAEGDEVRGVLLVKPRGNGNVVASPNVSLFVPPRTGPAGEAVVRALLDQVEFRAASGGVHVSGLAQEWLPLVRERAAAASARESWLLPCLALHCPEARFVSQPDPSAQLLAQSLRLDTISPSSTRAVFVLSSLFVLLTRLRCDRSGGHGAGGVPVEVLERGEGRLHCHVRGQRPVHMHSPR